MRGERGLARAVRAPGRVNLIGDHTDSWGRYPAGVLRTLAERGRPPFGIDAEVSSTVPPGAGLASSAALEVAFALAFCDAAGFTLPKLELALRSRATRGSRA